MKVKKGDIVKIIAGKDKGKTGEVVSVLPHVQKVLVKGVNIAVHHMKAKERGKTGEILRKEAPVHVSNVMVMCQDTNKPTRIGFRMEGDEKVRYSKQSGKVIA